jgi:23S rRNA (adenine2030-N6)-methyltransferase
MNYRHGFHAGNHADVLKHAALLALANHMRLKPKPFFALDTHAGAGRYDLTSTDALRSGEFRHGVARLLAADDLPPALKPYVEAVRAANPPEALNFYPGSPLFIANALRPGDRLTACELNPGQAAALGATLAPFRGARAESRDGYAAAKALVPPPERRGLVLFDPPFERGDEFALLGHALIAAWKRWPTGAYLAWYPLKDRAAADGFHAAVVGAGIRDVVSHELFVRDAGRAPGMAGSALLAVNAGFALNPLMETALPYLARRLAQGPGSAAQSRQLAPE